MKQTKNKAAKATALFFVLGLVVFELPLYQGGSSCGSNKKMMQRCWRWYCFWRWVNPATV
ncbi:hypothetical protein CPI43_03520 [Moraxella catarrhalis]|nr:hypothetical protein [Moraxella catarrhalis]